MRVLVVEDDQDLADGILEGLRQQHFAVDHAPTVAAAVELAIATTYDVVCLDLGLPDGDGLNLCRALQSVGQGKQSVGQGTQLPSLQQPGRVLVLTARDAVTDRVAGLDAGADDYLIKPFKLVELAARIRALTRRRDHTGTTLVAGDLLVDLNNHTAKRGETLLQLTSREFSVLRYLTSHKGELVTAEALLEHCWDANADPFSTSVRVILSRLRRKLGQPDLIETVKGSGYRLRPETETEQ